MGITAILTVTSNSSQSIEKKYEALCKRLEKKFQIQPTANLAKISHLAQINKNFHTLFIGLDPFRYMPYLAPLVLIKPFYRKPDFYVQTDPLHLPPKLYSPLSKAYGNNPTKNNFQITMDSYVSTKKEVCRFTYPSVNQPNNYPGIPNTNPNLPPQEFKKEYHKKFYICNLSEFPTSTFTIFEPNPIPWIPNQVPISNREDIKHLKNPNKVGIHTIDPTIDHVTISDKNFIAMIDNLTKKNLSGQSIFNLENNKQIKAQGNRYVFNDFIICPAIVYISGQPRSIILSVEYTPVIIAELSEALIQDFLDGLKLNEMDMSDPSLFDDKENKLESDSGAENLEGEFIEFEISPVKRHLVTAVNNYSIYRPQETILQYLNLFKNLRSQASYF